MAVTNDLPNFPLSGFKHPERIDSRAAAHLVDLRERFGFPLIITDDARLPGEAPPGASATSWHYKGQAFDLRIRDWTKERLYLFVEAVMELGKAIDGPEGGIELELVYSDKDKHAHIAFFLNGAPSRLIIAAD